MPFKIGDRVVHPAHRTGQIVNVLAPYEYKPPAAPLELASRLKQGSFQGVCEVMRDLTAWGWGEPLGQADRTTLQKTQDSLYQEWAMAADVSTTEAIKEIDSLLLAAQPTPIGVMGPN